MKLFIIPTSTSFCPFLRSYPREDNDSLSIVWDRLANEEDCNSKIIYRDSKIGYQRGIIDYIRFSFFVTLWLLKRGSQEDRVVVFSPQLIFFIWPVLLLKKCKYIVDYRDYHRLTRFTPPLAYTRASLVVVSSPLYKSVLPKKAIISVCHNFHPEDSPSGIDKEALGDNPIVVSCIGAIRDFQANSELIEALGNDSRFEVRFDGEGACSNELISFSKTLDCKNVFFTGRYRKQDESRLYSIASAINLLRYSEGYNDRVALPNRLYNAALNRRPVICYTGTLLAKYVVDYGLGVCVENKECIKKSLIEYFSNFDHASYTSNASAFLSDIVEENQVFKETRDEFYRKG